MKKEFHDERIIQEARKQNSVGFTILYFGVLLDLLYRQFIIHDPISRYWDLALLFFGVSFYLAFKRVSTGLLTTNKVNWKRIIPSSIVATVVFSLVNCWYFDKTAPIELMLGAIIFFIGFCGINLLMQYLSCKKNDDILKDE